MPIATTSVKVLPVIPFHSPLRSGNVHGCECGWEKEPVFIQDHEKGRKRTYTIYKIQKCCLTNRTQTDKCCIYPRMALVNFLIWSRTFRTSGTTSFPSTLYESWSLARRARCITARSSEVLRCAPAAMAAIWSSESAGT